MGPRASLDGRKFSLHRDSILRTVHPGSSVAIPTELPGPQERPFSTKIIMLMGRMSTVNQSRYRHGVAQRVPGSSDSQIS